MTLSATELSALKLSFTDWWLHLPKVSYRSSYEVIEHAHEVGFLACHALLKKQHEEELGRLQTQIDLLRDALENDAVRLLRAAGFTMQGTATTRIMEALAATDKGGKR